jgi:D-alanyl-D-alanine carboxypeptidase (penicillin-binding protein 5/6)
MELAFFIIAVFPLYPQNPASDAPDIRSRAAVLLDSATGTILYMKNPDEEISPASLTKLMTIHLVLKEVAGGRASLEETQNPPRESWAINQPPRSSLMFLAGGQRVSLRELLLGLAVSSGNDAAVAAALRFAPSVAGFVELMNREARELGLEKTVFTEPSGISEYNMTTAREFARFCRIYLELHPETLSMLHSVKEFSYPMPDNVGTAYRDKPNTIKQVNHNYLLGKVEGVDGLKTGYIDEAGFNIALTAERERTRFIAVILGAPPVRDGDKIRDEDGRLLLEWAFSHYRTVRPPVGDLPPARVWKGMADQVRLGYGAPLEFTALRSRLTDLRWERELWEPLTAPLLRGSSVGDLVFYDSRGEVRRVPLITTEEIPPGSFFKRLWDSISLFFRSFTKD